MSSKRPRRNHAPEEKAAILRRHLVDKVPVSDLCDEHDVSPSLFYLWQRQAMERLEGKRSVKPCCSGLSRVGAWAPKEVPDVRTARTAPSRPAGLEPLLA
jgi:transposase-like protein